jgi:hypothetical protein
LLPPPRLFALFRPLLLFATDYFAAHISLIRNDPSERFLSFCRISLSTVERDLS